MSGSFYFFPVSDCLLFPVSECLFFVRLLSSVSECVALISFFLFFGHGFACALTFECPLPALLLFADWRGLPKRSPLDNHGRWFFLRSFSGTGDWPRDSALWKSQLESVECRCSLSLRSCTSFASLKVEGYLMKLAQSKIHIIELLWDLTANLNYVIVNGVPLWSVLGTLFINKNYIR